MFLWPSSHRKSARILSPGRCRRYTCRFSFSFFFFFFANHFFERACSSARILHLPTRKGGKFLEIRPGVSRSKRGDENLNGANSFLWNECKYWLLRNLSMNIRIRIVKLLFSKLTKSRTAEIIRFKYILEDWSFFCGTNLYLFSIIIRSVKLLSTFRDPFKCTRVSGSVSNRRFCRRMKNKTAE